MTPADARAADLETVLMWLAYDDPAALRRVQAVARKRLRRTHPGVRACARRVDRIARRELGERTPTLERTGT